MEQLVKLVKSRCLEFSGLILTHCLVIPEHSDLGLKVRSGTAIVLLLSILKITLYHTLWFLAPFPLVLARMRGFNFLAKHHSCSAQGRFKMAYLQIT
jgi:hypothetical protein